jgi:DNA polymerase III subunit chi
MNIGFYQLTKTSVEIALPKLLNLTLESGKRGLVKLGSDSILSDLDDLLWTYDNYSWLPHGSKEGKYSSFNPIWITTDSENPNKSEFVFMLDGYEPDELVGFERCFDLFDGNDQSSVAAARERWKILKGVGHDLHYWQQSDEGKWFEKS